MLANPRGHTRCQAPIVDAEEVAGVGGAAKGRNDAVGAP